MEEQIRISGEASSVCLRDSHQRLKVLNTRKQFVQYIRRVWMSGRPRLFLEESSCLLEASTLPINNLSLFKASMFFSSWWSLYRRSVASQLEKCHRLASPQTGSKRGSFRFHLWQQCLDLWHFMHRWHLFCFDGQTRLASRQMRTRDSCVITYGQPDTNNSPISRTAQHSLGLAHSNSPLQLLDRHGDLEVMSQNMKGSEDVCPLDHLSQRTPLEHFGAENISRLFRQEADMDQDLEDGDKLRQRR